MQQEESGDFIKYVLIALVVLVIAGAAIIFGINYLSQPALPPSSTPTSPSTTSGMNPNTGMGTTGNQTPTTNVNNGSNTPGTGTNGGSSVPTQGGVSDGVITSICGGPSRTGGINDSSGTCGRCVNLNGTDGYCEPESDETVQVIGCADKTGTDCDLEVDESAIIDFDSTGEVYISDYIEDACTIKLRVVNSEEIEDIAIVDPAQLDIEPVDYLVYQNDDCSEIEFDYEGLNLDSGDDGTGQDNDGQAPESLPETNDSNQAPPADEPTTEILQCGDSCSSSSQCPNNHSCLQGVCTANICIESGINTCDNNGCTLPKTDFISKEVDIVILGSLVAIIGLFVWRFRMDKELFLVLGGKELLMSEEELEEKRRQDLIEQSRSQRKEFGEQVLSKNDKLE